MGLDMYLHRCDRTDHSVQELVDFHYGREETLEDYVGEHTIGELMEITARRESEAFFETVGEWRNAWNIHEWISEHIRNEEDDCSHTELKKEQLESLLKTCKQAVLFHDYEYFGHSNIDEHYWYQIALTILIIEYALSMDWEANRFFYYASF